MHKGGAEMKKNNSKLKVAVAVALAALLLIAVNLCVSKLSEKLGLRLDMTSNKLYELSDETLKASRISRTASCLSSSRTLHARTR